MIKRILAIFSAVFIVLSFSACESKISNKALQKLLENDADFKSIDWGSAKAISESELGGDTKLLLFSAKESNSSEVMHHIAILNTDTDDIRHIEHSYPPLKFLQEEIMQNRTQSMNVDYFKSLQNFIAENGDDCFESEEKSIEFLKEISSGEGIISTDTAREIVVLKAKEHLNSIDAEDFCAVFENDSAVPLCYGGKRIESAYSWDWLPESRYLTFVSSASNQELSSAEEKYGPAYEEKTVWVSYDLDGEKLNIYKSKVALFEDVSGEKADFEEEVILDGVLKLATVSNKSPFAYKDSSGQITGIDIEVSKAIAKELGMELEISTMSPNDAINITGKGNSHMAMAGFTTSDKGNNITYTDNYYDNYAIILCKNGGKINSQICSALSELNSDGIIKSIVEKYNVKAPEETKPEETPEIKPDTEESSISYRVRKSSDDIKSQIGAFASLENAKKHADQYKDEGYKVFDMDGKLVYTPR